MRPLISIIVPVFKVEKYLERCVNSIVNQTYTNIEIILVDDGSPDKCGEMCDNWAAKDARVKSYHKPNRGLSDARNYGVLRTNGEYITFIDSDDYVATNYIEYLFGLIRDYNVGIACCNLRKTEHSDEMFGNQPIEKIAKLTNVEACKGMFSKEYGVQMVVACGKIYQKQLVQNNPFPCGKLHEDEATTYKFLYGSAGVVVSNQELYAYYQNGNSITHMISEKNEVDTESALSERIKFFEDKAEWELYGLTVEVYVWYLMQQTSEFSKKQLSELLKKKILNRRIYVKTKIKIMSYLLLRRKN